MFEEEFIKRVLTPVVVVTILTGAFYIFYNRFVGYIISIGFASLYFYTKYTYEYGYEEDDEEYKTNEIREIEMEEMQDKIEEPIYQNIPSNPYDNVNTPLNEDVQDDFDEIFGANNNYNSNNQKYTDFDERNFEHSANYGQPMQKTNQSRENQNPQRTQIVDRRNLQSNKNIAPIRQNNSSINDNRNAISQSKRQNKSQNPTGQKKPISNVQNRPQAQKRVSSNEQPQMQRTKIQSRPTNKKQINNQAIRQKQTQRKKINYDDDFEYEYYPYDE